MKCGGVECPIALNGAKLLRRIRDGGDRYSQRIVPDIGCPRRRPGGSPRQDQATMDIADVISQLFLEFGKEVPRGKISHELVC